MSNVLIRDKRGEKLLSIWWFFILAFVGGGIIIGIAIFYSADTSVKKIEAEVLLGKILDCVVEEGFLDSELANEKTREGFDIYAECKLNKEVIDGDFYFKISLDDILILSGGNPSFEENCEIDKEVVTKGFPGCTEIFPRDIFYYDVDGLLSSGKLKALTASNQKGKKIVIVE
jgi:hypothetical protein